jgi:hypothetical protein
MMYRLEPRGKIKFVIFPNDLESLRDLCKRVLHVAYIELWGLAVLIGATYDHRVTHPPLVVRTRQDDSLSYGQDNSLL